MTTQPKDTTILLVLRQHTLNDDQLEEIQAEFLQEAKNVVPFDTLQRIDSALWVGDHLNTRRILQKAERERMELVSALVRILEYQTPAIVTQLARDGLRSGGLNVCGQCLQVIDWEDVKERCGDILEQADRGVESLSEYEQRVYQGILCPNCYHDEPLCPGDGIISPEECQQGKCDGCKKT